MDCPFFTNDSNIENYRAGTSNPTSRNIGTTQSVYPATGYIWKGLGGSGPGATSQTNKTCMKSSAPSSIDGKWTYENIGVVVGMLR